VTPWSDLLNLSPMTLLGVPSSRTMSFLTRTSLIPPSLRHGWCKLAKIEFARPEVAFSLQKTVVTLPTRLRVFPPWSLRAPDTQQTPFTPPPKGLGFRRRRRSEGLFFPNPPSPPPRNEAFDLEFWANPWGSRLCTLRPASSTSHFL